MKVNNTPNFTEAAVVALCDRRSNQNPRRSQTAATAPPPSFPSLPSVKDPSQFVLVAPPPQGLRRTGRNLGLEAAIPLGLSARSTAQPSTHPPLNHSLLIGVHWWFQS